MFEHPFICSGIRFESLHLLAVNYFLSYLPVPENLFRLPCEERILVDVVDLALLKAKVFGPKDNSVPVQITHPAPLVLLVVDCFLLADDLPLLFLFIQVGVLNVLERMAKNSRYYKFVTRLLLEVSWI